MDHEGVERGLGIIPVHPTPSVGISQLCPCPTQHHTPCLSWPLAQRVLMPLSQKQLRATTKREQAKCHRAGRVSACGCYLVFVGKFFFRSNIIVQI
jgi:hypothetical protein